MESVHSAIENKISIYWYCRGFIINQFCVLLLHQRFTDRVIIQHELHCVEFDKLPNTAVADREIT